MSRNIVVSAFIDAGATALYIIGVAFFLTHAPEFFRQQTVGNLLVPIVLLLVFVISAAVTGALVLGRPALWYTSGARRNAVTLFLATLAFLAVFAFLFAVLLLF